MLMNLKKISLKNPCLAIFDLDNTLIEGDCELIWCEFLAKKGIVDNTFIETIRGYFLKYDAGTIIYSDYEKYLVSPLINYPALYLNQLINEYMSHTQKLAFYQLINNL